MDEGGKNRERCLRVNNAQKRSVRVFCLKEEDVKAQERSVRLFVVRKRVLKVKKGA